MNVDRVRQLYEYLIEEVEDEKRDRLMGDYPTESIIRFYSKEIKRLKNERDNAIHVLQSLDEIDRYYKLEGK